MIVKIQKVPFTFNAKHNSNKKGVADFANHLYYLVSDKTTKLYSEKRCDLEMNIDPKLADFGQYLKIYGHTLTAKQLKQACFDEALRQKQFFLEPVLNSSKRKFLDKNGECFDKTKLFNYKCNFTFQKHEYERILKSVNNDEYKAKKKMQEIKNEYFCIWFNEMLKHRNISTRLKHEDIRSLDNWHIKGEANPHIHTYLSCYDHKTGRMMNSRMFSVSKQKAHMLLEKKYKEFIDQGIALGFDKIEGLEQRRNYLIEQFENGYSMRQSIDNYRALQNRVREAYIAAMREPAKLKEILAQHDIEQVKANESGVNLRFKESSAIFNIESFRDKKVRDLLNAHKERVISDRTSFVKVHQLEEVIQSNYTAVQEILNKKLSETPQQHHNTVKRNAFKLYAKRLKKAGIIIDLTKQGAATYIVQSVNGFKSEKNVALSPFKSSLMINNQLHGKALLSDFEITQDDITKHGIDYMSGVPKSLRYGKKRAYATMDLEESNLVSFEAYRLKFSQSYLTKFGIEKLNLENGFVLLKNNQPLLKVERHSDDSAILTTSNVYPKQAANLLYETLIEDAKNLDKDKQYKITSMSNSSDDQSLRELHIKLMFSTDKNARNIYVDYPGIERDAKLQQMIQEQIDVQLAKCDKSFKTAQNKVKKGVFNFTEATGVGLIKNPKMTEHKHLIEAKLNSQIVELITKHDVKEIKFNQRVDVEYFKDNQHKLLELSQHLSKEEQDKVKRFLEELDQESQTTMTNKNQNKNEQKSSNKIRTKRKI